MNGIIEYGDIYLVGFAPSVGHEFQGDRPAVVVQPNEQLAKTNLVTVIPLTSKVDKAHSGDILIKKDEVNRLFCDSLVKVHNIESFDRSRFIKKIGKISTQDSEKIKIYLIRHFDLLSANPSKI
ncbi:MAG: type II toxin-antitoxin system PemK/MazF family toxin [Candidatus Paceibacterota bacterium]|jgi:mRNA-degrading endonuclease toxin of MazEF toxin-antitoxin module